jgi:ketosteroid isomerase-like protein
MTNVAMRQRVRDFYQARMSRDPAKIAPFLDEDVTWSISGPIDLIPFCGQRRGKEAVMDAIVRLAPAVMTVTKVEFEELLVDGDRVAGFTRLTAIRAGGAGRIISYHRAEFFRFRDNKIVAYRAILDSLDAAEQVLGHSIDLSQTPKQADDGGDLIIN